MSADHDDNFNNHPALPNKPGPDATTWENDYKAFKHWRAAAFKVWHAIPMEFHGDLKDPNPASLHEKVERIVEALEAARKELAELKR